MKRSGALQGTGAVYAWDGDGNVGQGRMEITEAAAPSKVAIQLDFTRPFEAHNRVVFRIVPNNYVSKRIGVFVSIDRMVGRDFEAGLANLKSIAEK